MSASTARIPQASGMRLILPVETAAASAARHAVRQFARMHGAAEATTADIALAVSEAVSNVIAHARDEASQAGAVILAAERDGDALRVLVRDHGVTRHGAGLGSGLGLATIGQVAQSLEVRIDETGGAEMRMKFQLAA